MQCGNNIFPRIKLQAIARQSSAVETLRDHPDKRPPLIERPLDNVNPNVFISTPDERPPLLKGQFSGAKGVGSQ